MANPAVTSTSTTSPGSAAPAPAGVPVSSTSPRSSVIVRDTSATSSPNENSSSSAVTASWTSTPLCHVRSTSVVSSSRPASSRRGPIGVYPSPPVARSSPAPSASARSGTEHRLAAVTATTWPIPSSGRTDRAGSPITRAIAPANATWRAPSGHSSSPPRSASDDGGRSTYDGCSGDRPVSVARLA